MKLAASAVSVACFSLAPVHADEIHTEGPVAGGGAQGIYVPVAPEQRAGMKALIVTGFGFNDMETFYPFYRFTEEGFDVTVASPEGGDIQGYGGHIMLDTKRLSEVDVTDYHILYLPGGRAPGTLRENDDVISAVKAFAETGRPIAAVCHGPQILVTAGLVKGVDIACFSGVGTEVEEAGGTYKDQPVAVHGQFITSRLPKDLPLQMRAIFEALDTDS